jgi:hypothetical protein
MLRKTLRELTFAHDRMPDNTARGAWRLLHPEVGRDGVFMAVGQLCCFVWFDADVDFGEKE